MITLEQMMVEEMIEDLCGITLVSSNNCSELTWAINSIDNEYLTG